MTESAEAVPPELTFGDKKYAVSFTMAPATGKDYTAENYEWTTGGEPIQTWTTLIVTQKLSPLSEEQPLSAENYAQNIASMHDDNNAMILETSVINEEDAKEIVDITDPPFIIITLYQGNENSLAEFNIQKIANESNGVVSSFIYAQRLNIFTNEALQAYLESAEFVQKRLDVIKAPFPY